MTTTRPTAIICASDPLRGAVRALLSTCALTVVGEFAYCAEAVEQLTREQPDVLVLDLESAAGYGVETVSRVLALSPRTDVIVLSPFPGLREVLRDAGAFEALEREDLGGLDDAVRRLLALPDQWRARLDAP